MFRYTILAFVLLLQATLYVRARLWLRDRFPRWRAAPIGLTALFILFNAAMTAVLLFRPRVAEFPGWFVALAVHPFYIWHGATLILGLIVLCGILLSLPFKGTRWLLGVLPGIGPRVRTLEARPAVQRFDASRRLFIRRGMYGLTAASFGGAGYGVLQERSSFEFTRVRLVLPELPPALDGFVIGMVSDIHSSAFMTKEDMDEYVKALLSLNADLLVLPGDFVNSMTDEVYPFAESFSALHAPCGVFGVMGNHDFFAQNPERVAREVNDCGVRILRQEHVVIEKNGASMALVGIDDTGRSDRARGLMQTALGNAPSGVIRVLLCHRPYFLDQAAAENIHVVLSGHTHGGQVVFGRFGEVTITPAQLASRYIWGVYRRGNTHMFVSRGIGTVGLPMRINCPPEVAVITLTRT
jgi:predicted MPP superfamily phosphohydrolase